MTKAKGFYMYDSNPRNKRKIDVVGDVNITNFSWHQGHQQRFQGKKYNKSLSSNHSVTIYTPLLALRRPLVLLSSYPTKIFLYENASKYKDRFLYSLYFLQRKCPEYILL